MTNNNLSKRQQLEQKRLEVLEEKKAIDLKKHKQRIVAGAVALTLVGSGIGYGASVLLNNDEPAIAADESENTKTSEAPNDNYYVESETEELEQKITDYFNSLDDLTKSEFNNNPQYLIDFGKWINGLEIEDFSDARIGEIYGKINDAKMNVYNAVMNKQPIQGTYIKPSVFIKPTHSQIKLFTDREAWLDEILKDPYGENSLEIAKKWFGADWSSLTSLNSAEQFSALDPAASEIGLKTGIFENLNFTDIIFESHGLTGMNLATPDGDTAFYPLRVGPTNTPGINLEEVSELEAETYYAHLITLLLERCDNYTNGDETKDDQDSYTTLYRTQMNYIEQRIKREAEEKKNNNDNNTSKLEKITDAKNKAYAVKEMYLGYVSKKDGAHVRVHSNIINS